MTSDIIRNNICGEVWPPIPRLIRFGLKKPGRLCFHNSVMESPMKTISICVPSECSRALSFAYLPSHGQSVTMAASSRPGSAAFARTGTSVAAAVPAMMARRDGLDCIISMFHRGACAIDMIDFRAL